VFITDENGCSASSNLYVLITAVEQIFSGGDLLVYPDPSDGNFIVELFNCSIADHVSLAIINPFGQVVFNSEEKVNGDHFSKSINMKELSSGVYLLEMKAGNSAIRKKFLILR
jgi:hypothetical protein